MTVKWSYRIICRKDKDGDDWYEVCEVYCKNNKPVWWTGAVTVCGVSVRDAKQEIRYIKEAFKKPVMDIKKVRGKDKLVERITPLQS